MVLAALTEADLGKKESIDTELDVAMKKRRFPPAEPEKADTCNYSDNFHHYVLYRSLS